MKKVTAPWVILFFLLQTAHSQTSSNPSFVELIKGSWVEKPAGNKLYPELKIISFENSFCTMYARLPYQPYEVNRDQLIINSKKSWKSRERLNFQIMRLNQSELTLRTLKVDPEGPDTVSFVRLSAQNSITPDKIIFASSDCYSFCPAMNIELDPEGNMFFFGTSNIDKKGGYSGKLSAEEYNNILTLIRELPIDSLKPHYSAQMTDQQHWGIAIVAGGKTIFTSAYGYYDEPPALRLLFHKLMESYKLAGLQPDFHVSQTRLFSDEAGKMVLRSLSED